MNRKGIEKMDIIAREQIIVFMVVEEELEQEGEKVSRTKIGEISLVTYKSKTL